ncbi:hypothetical protein FRB97_007893, partial [Tulasnella sp. 331]
MHLNSYSTKAPKSLNALERYCQPDTRLSGFTTFLQPSPFHLLAHAADEGHFIIINKGVEPDVFKLLDDTPEVVKHVFLDGNGTR